MPKGKGKSEPEQREARTVSALVRAGIEAGLSDQQIAVNGSLELDEVRDARKAIYAEELLETKHRSVDEIYVDYRIRMLGVARDLGEFADEVRAEDDSKGMNAAANALKSKAHIIDRIIDRGQEMGVIPRAAKRNVTVGGILVATATDTELVELMKERAQEAGRLAATYGDIPLLQMDVPEVYIGDPADEESGRGDVIDITPNVSRKPVRRKVV